MAAPPLNPNQTLFVEYLLAEEKLDATAAYLKVYKCKPSAAMTGACKLMADPRVKALVEARKAERLEQLGMTSGEILKELRAVVTADPRELMEYRRGACRYCHGAGHLYQRTPAEYRRDLAEHMRKMGESDPLGLKFDVQGGVGYNRTVAAHPDCPECFGEGEGYSYPKDSRTLSPAAARLFAGVKQTKDGIEIKSRATDKSVELLMRHGGMLADKDKDVGGTADEKAAKVRDLLAALKSTTGGSSNGA